MRTYKTGESNRPKPSQSNVSEEETEEKSSRIIGRIGAKYFPMASMTEFSWIRDPENNPEEYEPVTHCGALEIRLYEDSRV